jgi:hypothetical protein
MMPPIFLIGPERQKTNDRNSQEIGLKLPHRCASLTRDSASYSDLKQDIQSQDIHVMVA